MRWSLVIALSVALAASGGSPAAARTARHPHAKPRKAHHKKTRRAAKRKKAPRARTPAPASAAFSLTLAAPAIAAPVAAPPHATALAAPQAVAPAPVAPPPIAAPVPPAPEPAAAAPAAPAAAPPVAPSAGDEPFAADSVWTAVLPADAPLDRRSDELVADLVRQVTAAGPWINTSQYTAPVYEPPPGTPSVPVALDAGDPALRAALAAVPIPAGARPSKGTDGAMVVWSRAEDTVWELWRARLEADGWHAAWGGRIDHASASRGVFPAPYGVAASGLSLLGGMIRPHDVISGHIDHALAFCVPDTTAGIFVAPATRTDGTVRGGGIPEGTRFRLPADLDIAALGLPSLARKIAEAAQRYGIIVNDHGGAVSFYGEDPASIGLDPWPTFLGNRYPNQILERFPWDKLEVVAPP